MFDISDQLLGDYIYQEIDSKTGFGNEFVLKLFKDQKNKLRFKFIMATIGPFGKMGETWEGIGVSRGDHLALVIEKQSNWVEDKDKKNQVSDSENTLQSLPIELYPHEDNVAIFHKKIDKLIVLKPLEQEPESNSI